MFSACAALAISANDTAAVTINDFRIFISTPPMDRDAIGMTASSGTNLLEFATGPVFSDRCRSFPSPRPSQAVEDAFSASAPDLALATTNRTPAFSSIAACLSSMPESVITVAIRFNPHRMRLERL